MDNSDTGGMRLKRKRKPSEKVLELQAEKSKKPVQKTKPIGKSEKKNKPGVDQDSDVSN